MNALLKTRLSDNQYIATVVEDTGRIIAVASDGVRCVAEREAISGAKQLGYKLEEGE